MKTYILRGLAEGLTGRASVQAKNLDELFAQFPALQSARSKLSISGSTISGFAACDG